MERDLMKRKLANMSGSVDAATFKMPMKLAKT